MRYYILVILSALCYAVQFAVNKLYQTKKGSAIETSLKFLALKGGVAACVFFIVAWIIYGKPLTVTPMSVLLACITSVLACGCFIVGFVIFKYGSMSVFSTFLMIGGMTLPFIYSAFRGEELGAFKICGIVLLILSLVMSLLGKEKGERKSAKSASVFVLLCAAVFIFNGCVSVFSSIHSGDDFLWFTDLTLGRLFPNISRERVQGVEFTVLVNIANCIFCSAALGIVTLVQRLGAKRALAEIPDEKTPSKTHSNGKEAIFLFLLIAACAVLDALAFVLMRIVDGSGKIVASKYPIQTAFTVLLSALAGFVAFRERPDKWGLWGLAVTFLSTMLFII